MATKFPPKWKDITLLPRQLLTRVGRCLAFGCNPQQTAAAAAIVSEITQQAAVYEARSHGYVTLDKAFVRRTRIGDVDGRSIGIESDFKTSGRHYSQTWFKDMAFAPFYTRLANQQSIRALEYAKGTAEPDIQAKWDELLYQKGGPDGHGGVFTHVHRCIPIATPSDVSIFPQITRKIEGDSLTLAIRTMIWSHHHMLTVGLVEQRFRTWNRTFPDWLFNEVRRLTQRREAGPILRLMNEVEHLENETWKNPEAKEDRGGAEAGKSGEEVAVGSAATSEAVSITDKLADVDALMEAAERHIKPDPAAEADMDRQARGGLAPVVNKVFDGEVWTRPQRERNLTKKSPSAEGTESHLSPTAEAAETKTAEDREETPAGPSAEAAEHKPAQDEGKASVSSTAEAVEATTVDEAKPPVNPSPEAAEDTSAQDEDKASVSSTTEAAEAMTAQDGEKPPASPSTEPAGAESTTDEKKSTRS